VADYTFFHNPMSRSAIAAWAFAEVGADFEVIPVEWADKPKALLEANPMGKLPTIIHHTPAGDRVVSEAPAVCHYLAEAERSDLMPTPGERAAYFRWLFFAAGPVETAVTAQSMGWEVPEDKGGTVGFGSMERVADALDSWFSAHDFVCGDRFTMADVYVGSQLFWGVRFNELPDRASFRNYVGRFSTRDAFKDTLGAIPTS